MQKLPFNVWKRESYHYTDNNYTEAEDVHELLGMTTDSKLTFENHINKFCKKSSQELNAVARICNFIAFE